MIIRRFIEHEKRQAARRFKFDLITGCALFFLGFIAGVRRNEIRAYIKDRLLPENSNK